MTRGRPLLYLASHSPRRRELLRQIGVRFETLLLRSDPIRGSDVEEIPQDGEAPTDYVNRVTLEKARVGAVRARERGLAPGLVLAADSEAARRIAFWIARPMPPGQDEFSVAGLALLGTDGGCRTE